MMSHGLLPKMCVKYWNLSNPSMLLLRLDEDERSQYSLGRQGETNIVNEFGLYNLVLGSRKPEAKLFKRWITHDVIPSIHKTGSYSVPAVQPQPQPLVVIEDETERNLVEAINAFEIVLSNNPNDYVTMMVYHAKKR